MNVSDVDQGHVAEGIELKQLILAEGLLRAKACPIAEARGTNKR